MGTDPYTSRKLLPNWGLNRVALQCTLPYMHTARSGNCVKCLHLKPLLYIQIYNLWEIKRNKTLLASWMGILRA
jgi:hypothetical protein